MQPITERDRYDALLEALDQYVSNQSEYEHDENDSDDEALESTKLRAARELLDRMLAPMLRLADEPAAVARDLGWPQR